MATGVGPCQPAGYCAWGVRQRALGGRRKEAFGARQRITQDCRSGEAGLGDRDNCGRNAQLAQLAAAGDAQDVGARTRKEFEVVGIKHHACIYKGEESAPPAP